MKKITILLLIIALYSLGIAQLNAQDTKVKYNKDIAPLMQAKNYVAALPKLLTFYAQNSEPNGTPSNKSLLFNSKTLYQTY